jgi:hypothetical protein
VANAAIAAARGIADLKNTMLTLVESGLDSVCPGELGVLFSSAVQVEKGQASPLKVHGGSGCWASLPVALRLCKGRERDDSTANG